MYENEKYGNWINIDNTPEAGDTYLVAWPPKDMKREECFVALAEYDTACGWVSEDFTEVKKLYGEIELFAWMPLPEMYKAKGLVGDVVTH